MDNRDRVDLDVLILFGLGAYLVTRWLGSSGDYSLSSSPRRGRRSRGRGGSSGRSAGSGVLGYLFGDLGSSLPSLGAKPEPRPKPKPKEESAFEELPLADLFKRKDLQLLSTKRNPSPEVQAALRAKPPKDRKALARAFALSEAFHGTPSEVVELSPEERRLGKYVVVAGELRDFAYQPGDDSNRGGTVWEHKSGDRGEGAPESPHAPLVVVDPETRRPAIVANRSPMRWSSKRGFVG